MKLYQHFKGGLYVVIDEHVYDWTNVTVENGPRHLVLYHPLTGGPDLTGTREFDQFHENVEHDGKVGPRFRFIADSADIMPNGGHP